MARQPRGAHGRCVIERESADSPAIAEPRPDTPGSSLLPAVPFDAPERLEIARQRGLELDHALAELRSSLRAAPPPAAPGLVDRHGSSRQEMEPAAVYRWLLLDGHEASCRGRLTDALAIFEQAAREGPRRIEGHLNVGRTLLRMRRYADARAAFDRATALEPENAAARAGLADCDWRLALPEVQPAPEPRPRARFRLPSPRPRRPN